MDTGWRTIQMEKREGELVLVVQELYHGGTWASRVFLHADWRSAVHELPESKTGMDAIAAVEHYARQLGPVEPVLALVRFFAAARKARTRRAA